MDILVRATPFRIEKGKWGYKWVGVCSKRKFTVVLNPYAKEMYFNENLFVICEQDQEKYLPEEILKVMYSIPLSNEYFTTEGTQDYFIGAVTEIIEKGYDIKDVMLQNGKYIQKSTGKIIAELCWKWKGAV